MRINQKAMEDSEKVAKMQSEREELVSESENRRKQVQELSDMLARKEEIIGQLDKKVFD